MPEKEALFPGAEERRRKEKEKKKRQSKREEGGVGSSDDDDALDCDADAAEEARKAELKQAADKLLNRVEGNAKRAGGGYAASASRPNGTGTTSESNDDTDDSKFVMIAKTIHVSRASRVRWLKQYLVERVFAEEVSDATPHVRRSLSVYACSSMHTLLHRGLIKKIAEINAACDAIRKEFGTALDSDTLLSTAIDNVSLTARDTQRKCIIDSTSPADSSPSSSSAASSALGSMHTSESEALIGDKDANDAEKEEKGDGKEIEKKIKGEIADWTVEYRLWDYMNNKLYAPLEGETSLHCSMDIVCAVATDSRGIYYFQQSHMTGNESEARTLKESRILDKQAMLLERRGPETLQVWKEHKKAGYGGTSYTYGRVGQSGAEGRDKASHRGLVGLRNQGYVLSLEITLEM